MKKIETTPFDTQKVPPKQNLFFLPFLWLVSFVATRSGKLKIHKVNMKGLKPPFLVLGSHHAFLDFGVTQLSLFPHRANYVSELEGFEAYGEWFYRQLGCLGVRKFFNDINLVRNIKRVMDRKGILVLYPEARYSNVGSNSKLPVSVFKLVKMLKVPVVVLNMKGNYLQSPIWNLKTRKGVRLDATLSQILTKEEILHDTIDEIGQKLQQALTYDEYQYQYETKQKILFENRAEGIEYPLYQCPVCKSEFKMISSRNTLTCQCCNSKWEMTEYGKMKRLTEKSESDQLDFTHIPDWYEWERKEVEKEIDNGRYNLSAKVRIEALPNSKNFIQLGEGKLVQDENGFDLTLKDYQEKEIHTLHFSAQSMTSIHTEYNYRNKGQCVTLSTANNTYFLFPLEEGFNATKIQVATEYLYGKSINRH